MSPRLTAYILLVFATLMWAGHAVVGKLAVGQVSPFFLVTLRWAIVAPLATLIIWPQFKANWHILKKHLPFAFMLAIAGFTLFNSLFYLATHRTSAINIGITQGAMPIFVLLISRIMHQHTIGFVKLLGILITLAGVVVVTTAGSLTRLLELNIAVGDLLMLMACLGYAFYANGLHKRPKINVLVFFALLAWCGLISSVPLSLYEAIAGDFVFVPTHYTYILVLYIAILPSFLSQISFLKGVDLIGPSRAGIFINLIPIFAAIFAILILDEPFMLYHAIALAMVLVGIYIAERKPQDQSR